MNRKCGKHYSAARVLLTLAILSATSQIMATDSPHLLGDWGGKRTSLEQDGVVFDFGYASEAAHNFSGGTAHLTRYTDQWKLGTALDLDKLWGWHGASFQMMVTDRNGRNLGSDANIGNNQLLQEVYGRGQTWHLSVLALEQKFFDGKLDWRLGRLLAGSEFAAFSCDFQNLTFCGSQPGNIVGDYWINWPTSVWATTLKLHTSDATYLTAGAFQINPNYVDDGWARKNGWKPNFPAGTKGTLFPVEFGWTPDAQGRPGSYKLGAWYSTARQADLYFDLNGKPIGITGNQAMQHDSRYGFYVNLEQQIGGAAPGEGPSIFLNASQADRATSATDRQIAGGVEFKGMFGRPQDMLGVAVGATHANERAGKTARLHNLMHPHATWPVKDGNEYVAEVFYNWSPITSVNLRPNVQYVLHPGGNKQNHNATVLGLKSSVAF